MKKGVTERVKLGCNCALYSKGVRQTGFIYDAYGNDSSGSMPMGPCCRWVLGKRQAPRMRNSHDICIFLARILARPVPRGNIRQS